MTTKAQNNMIERLLILPHGGPVEVRTNLSIRQNLTTSEEVVIEGGQTFPDKEPCKSCGHKKFGGWRWIRLRWHNGKFASAEVGVNNTRRNFKSIERAWSFYEGPPF